MAMYKIALWDVDTQHDFMDEKGALYVPGAEKIKIAIQNLISFGRFCQVPIFGSIDSHKKDDPEFAMFPEHCVKGTYGYSKIFAPNLCDVYFGKNTFDIFTNPDAEKFITNTAERYVVFGVATDYCVKEVVLGMRKRGKQVYVVMNAIKGVDKETTEEAICKMIRVGAKLIDSIELRKILNDK